MNSFAYCANRPINYYDPTGTDDGTPILEVSPPSVQTPVSLPTIYGNANDSKAPPASALIKNKDSDGEVALKAAGTEMDTAEKVLTRASDGRTLMARSFEKVGIDKVAIASGKILAENAGAVLAAPDLGKVLGSCAAATIHPELPGTQNTCFNEGNKFIGQQAVQKITFGVCEAAVAAASGPGALTPPAFIGCAALAAAAGSYGTPYIVDHFSGATTPGSADH